MIGSGNDGEARGTNAGFQAKLLSDVLRINPDAQKECAQGWLSLHAPRLCPSEGVTRMLSFKGTLIGLYPGITLLKPGRL